MSRRHAEVTITRGGIGGCLAAAAVVVLVDGIGQAIDLPMRLFDYGQLGTLVLAVMLLVPGMADVVRRERRKSGQVMGAPRMRPGNRLGAPRMSYCVPRRRQLSWWAPRSSTPVSGGIRRWRVRFPSASAKSLIVSARRAGALHGACDV